MNPFYKGQMTIAVFFQNLSLDELVDPEIDNAFGFDIQEAGHFRKRRHTPILPEERRD
jgi:hypothetical protein